MEERIKLSFNNSEKELPKYPSSFDELKQLFFQLFPEENRNNTYAFYYYFLELPININEENFEAKIEELYESANPIIYVQIENKKDDIFPTVVNSKVNEEQEQSNDVPSEKNLQWIKMMIVLRKNSMKRTSLIQLDWLKHKLLIKIRRKVRKMKKVKLM
jgi:hypothetical protein